MDFFTVGPKTNIKISNLDDCKINKKIFGPLLGITIKEVILVGKFYFEYIEKIKSQIGEPINNKYYYGITAKEVLISLNELGRDDETWRSVPIDTIVYIETSACEEVQTS